MFGSADLPSHPLPPIVQAVRRNRYVILPSDFEEGYKANVKKNMEDFDFYH